MSATDAAGPVRRTTARCKVVHLLPLDAARGAQAYARSLRDALAADGDEHRTMTLFASSPAALRADLSLNVPAGRWRAGGFDPRAAIRLRRALLALAPDVVVAHGGEALKYAALVRRPGVRLVYLKIGLTEVRLRSRLQGHLYGILAGRADAVVAVSDEMKEEAVRLLRLPAERITVIPNGRDPGLYRPGDGRSAGEPVRLAFVGYLAPAKRPELFCDVVRSLRERGYPVDAVLIGDGPLLDSLAPRARTAGVKLLGRRGDVGALLSNCDVLLFTGTAWEGMPGVLIEAGLCGLPAVTTDVPGARTVVEHEETGVVVGLDDREALVEGAARLVADPELRRRMGAAARGRCLERFTIQASARRWQAVLDGVLDGGGSARHAAVPEGG